MKKQKLSLNSIKVQSFITALDKEEKQTVAGGGNTNNPVCLSQVPACQRTVPPNVCADTILDCSIGIACTYVNCPSPL